MFTQVAEPCSRWQAFKTVSLIYIAWRLALMLFCFVLLNASSERPNNRHKSFSAFASNYYLDSWVRWDSNWYYDIASKGYYLRKQGQSNVTFFPGYPYLSRYLGKLTGSIFSAGLLLSHLATWIGLFFMFRIGTMFFSVQQVQLSMVLMLVFPGSLFLSAFYTEGMFFALASASLFYFLRNSFFLAGLLGCGAQFTRPVGLILFGTYGLTLLIQLIRDRSSFRWAWGWIFLIPGGLGAFMFLLYKTVGDPMAWKTHQSAWGGQPTFPLWTPLRYLFYKIDYGSFAKRGWNNEGSIHHLLNVFWSLGAIAGSAWMFIKRYPIVLCLYVTSGLAVTLYVGHLMSFNRHVIVLFPLFFVLADLCKHRRMLERWILFAFSFFLSFYLLRYLNWYWAG